MPHLCCGFEVKKKELKEGEKTATGRRKEGGRTEWRSEVLKGLRNNAGKRMREKMCDGMGETASKGSAVRYLYIKTHHLAKHFRQRVTYIC